ncbi:hypothetical protein ABMY35_20190 [Pseudoalteromonas sp. BZB3]|uniref:hypothetical protein n=1 Tax=Pseudoalteromonas sp. BZB3 TaxID=3136670 RepID=UPI0032C48779
MISENFSWTGSIHLKHDSTVYDLHNDYDFIKFSYDVEKRLIVLEWRKGKYDWVKSELPTTLLLSLFNVEHFGFQPRSSERSFNEDDCLSSFGYLSDDEWCEGQFWVDGDPDDSWHWSLEFESGAELIVSAESAFVKVEP